MPTSPNHASTAFDVSSVPLILVVATHDHARFFLAHARRKFVDVHKDTKSPASAEIIEQIGRVYAAEARIRGTSAEHRLAVRQAETVPLMAALKALLETRLAQVSTQSSRAKAIRYALGHWTSLIRFLDDGRIEVDTNTVERSMRGIDLARKSSLFADNDGGAHSWAVLASLVQTAKLNGLDPYTWLNDVLERMVSGEVKNNQLEQLLPWNWKARQATLALDMAA